MQEQNYRILIVRPAVKDDLAPTLELIEKEGATIPWLESIPELFTTAIRESAAKSWACVVEGHGKCVGVGVYGITAGTVGTGVIQAVVSASGAGSKAIGLTMIRYVVDDLRLRDARLVTAELPEHSFGDGYRSLLLAQGFVQESRVEDYYADGIALLHFRFDFE